MKELKNNKKRAVQVFMALIMISFYITQSSCKKNWLDEKANKQLAVPSSIKDFQAMLDYYGIQNAINLRHNEVAADGHYYTESISNTFKGKETENMYKWANDVAYNSNQWLQTYTPILYTNVILDESEKLNIDDLGIVHVRAQALFQRARKFLDLAQTFAPVYNAATASVDLGIPLRLNSDVTEPSSRSTLQQTYMQIINDLVKAKDNLPVNPESLTRASKPAALALLARTYLFMSDYENARKYADECLALKSSLLNYSSIPSTATFIGINPEVLFININVRNDGELTDVYLVDQSLYDTYDPNDLRKQVFFKVGPTGITFKGSYSNSAVQTFFGLATDEVYLIRAECTARAGNIGLAMKDLNDLLRTRWAKNADGTTKYVDQLAVDATDALRKILLERRKQLILRNVRWSDLRRLNLDPRFAVTLTRTIGGETYTLEPNSFRYTFPIPQEVIEKTGMAQNTGW